MQGLMGRVRVSLAVAVAWLVWSASPALASTYTVTNTNDSGNGSLRAAVTAADNDPNPPATINFSTGPSATITLTSGVLTLSKSMNIVGPGAGALRVDGRRAQIFSVPGSVTVSISGLTFSGAGGVTDGGAIVNNGALTISDDVFNDNAAGSQGGAIDSGGTLTVIDSTFSDNTAGGAGSSAPSSGMGDGGAIFNGGTLTVTGSTFIGNGAGGAGGSGQQSGEGLGGAIETFGNASLTDDTFVGNSAGGAGGSGSGSGSGVGGALDAGASTTLQSDTIDANSAGSAGGVGGGIANEGFMTVIGTIVSGDTGGNCWNSNGVHNPGIMTSRESLEGPAGQSSCSFGLSADPQLAVLADNGGPTETQALGTGSPAIGAVPSAGDCPALDQRGSRRAAGGCDVGAYEVAPPTVGVASASGIGTAAASLAATGSNPDVQSGTVTFQYGTSSAYGNTTPPQGLTGGASGASFAASLTGLSPGTTYHFRVVAQNPDGTALGPDESFTTASSPGPSAPSSGSATSGASAPSAGASPPLMPSNGFTFGRAIIGKRGQLTLPVNGPGPGTFRATATFVVRARHGNKVLTTTVTYGTARLTGTGSGTFRLVIGLSPSAARELKLLGSRQVTITVTFTPTGGTARQRSEHVTVKRSRTGHYS